MEVLQGTLTLVDSLDPSVSLGTYCAKMCQPSCDYLFKSSKLRSLSLQGVDYESPLTWH